LIDGMHAASEIETENHVSFLEHLCTI
jgi:hypothetical protein